MAVRFANESPQIWENSSSCLINLWLPGFYQGTSGFQESQWTKVRGLKHPINWYWQLQEGGSPQTEQNIKPILNPTNTQTAIKLFMIQMPTSQISQALCSHMYLPLLSASPEAVLSHSCSGKRVRVRKGAANYSIPPQTVFTSEIVACPWNLPNLCSPISVAERMASQMAQW